MTAFAHRKGAGPEVLAYSVRPDLWPPGWGDVSRPSSPDPRDRVYLVYYGTDAHAGSWYSRGQSSAVGDPGVAESLVLGSSHDLLELRGDLGGPGEDGTPMVHWVPCEELHDP